MGTPWTRDPAEARAGGSPPTRGVVRWRVIRRRLRSNLPTSADGRTPASPRTGRDGGPCSLPSRRSRPRSPDAASPTAWRRNASTACRARLPIHVPGYDARRGRSSARTATLALLSRSQRAVDPRARAITAAVAARNPIAMSSCEAMARPPPGAAARLSGTRSSVATHQTIPPVARHIKTVRPEPPNRYDRPVRCPTAHVLRRAGRLAPVRPGGARHDRRRSGVRRSGMRGELPPRTHPLLRRDVDERGGRRDEPLVPRQHRRQPTAPGARRQPCGRWGTRADTTDGAEKHCRTVVDLP